MSFWEGKAGAAANLRLFEPDHGWRTFDDVFDDQNRITAQGSHTAIELALNSALNASNVMLLTGAGSSFCATNSSGKRAPGMTDLWDAVVADVSQPVFDEIIALIPNAANLNKNIEKLLTLCKMYAALFSNTAAGKISKFIVAAEKAIVERVDFVDDETDLSSHRNLIRKFARRSVRKPRAKIFTTNYDLCFEFAARDQQFVVVDGFSHSSPQTYDRAHFVYDIVRREAKSEPPDYIENVFHLYKVHGSIDWRRKGPVIIRSRDESVGSPVLIYPRDSKFQEAFENPFLDLMGAFQSSLREPDSAILISGFGFNDEHITKPVMAAIEANITLRVVVCDVGFLDDAALAISPVPHVIPVDAAMRNKDNLSFERLRKLVTMGDQRLILINGRFEDLVYALPDLVAQTGRERHQDRMRRLGEISSGADVS